MQHKAFKIVTFITFLGLIIGVTVVFDPKQKLSDPRTLILPDGSSVEAELNLAEQNMQGWLGAQLTDLTPTIRKHLNFQDSYGVYVQDTLRDGPAQVSGILPGDIITQVNNIEVQDVLPTINLIATLNPGENYPITIFRQGKYIKYDVRILSKLNEQIT